MRDRLPSVVLLALLSLTAAGCATAPRIETAAVDVEVGEPEDSGSYGQFLAAQLAMNRGDVAEASRRFARAVRAEPGQRGIQDRAFMTALLAGQVDRAVALAPDAPPPPLESTPSTRPPQTREERRALADARRQQRELQRSTAAWRAARLTRAAAALKAGRGRDALAWLAPQDGETDAASALLLPWAQAQAGDWTAALAAPSETDAGTLGSYRLTRALLLERRGDRAAAEAAYAQLGDDTLSIVARGEFLERTGRAPEAVRLYDEALIRSEPPMLRAARERAAAGRRPPPVATFAQGGARSLLGPALLLSAARQHETALIYLRLVNYLDPEMDEALIVTGDTLAAIDNEAAAREAYARVAPEAPAYALAQGKLIASLQREDMDAEALQAAQAAVARAPRDVGLRLTLASVHMDQRRYDEALAALDGLDGADWRVPYARGVALERAGRWPEAEAALQEALRQRPNDAELLNALGYAWVDRGLNVEEASAMLDRAMQADPENGAIVDSVGWARYRLGRIEEAQRLLERAVQLSPEDPAINDHLGDVYWRTGRRREAEFQWRRVLTLEPDAALRAAVEAKLAGGRGPTDPRGSAAEAPASPPSAPATPAADAPARP